PRTPAARGARRGAGSARPTAVPVGLFGLQPKISRVRSVTAAARASRSCTYGAGASGPVSGTCTAVALPTCVTIGYASNERHANSTSSCGEEQVICTSSWHSATLPQPIATFATSTPRNRASPARSSPDWLSGYRWDSSAASTIALAAEGSGGNVVSLLASFTAPGLLRPGV